MLKENASALSLMVICNELVKLGMSKSVCWDEILFKSTITNMVTKLNFETTLTN